MANKYYIYCGGEQYDGKRLWRVQYEVGGSPALSIVGSLALGADVRDICISPNGLYLYICAGNYVYKYNSNLELQTGWGDGGSINLQNTAWRAVLDNDGYLVVAHDTNVTTGEVSLYDPNGDLVIHIDTPGGKGYDVSFDAISNGNILVCGDNGCHRYSRAGDWLNVYDPSNICKSLSADPTFTYIIWSRGEGRIMEKTLAEVFQWTSDNGNMDYFSMNYRSAACGLWTCGSQDDGNVFRHDPVDGSILTKIQRGDGVANTVKVLASELKIAVVTEFSTSNLWVSNFDGSQIDSLAIGTGTLYAVAVGQYRFYPNPIITASAGEGGSISPAGEVEVEHGADQYFQITSNDHYKILDILVDGESVGAVSEYTFYEVVTDHTIEASFEASEKQSLNPQRAVFASNDMVGIDTISILTMGAPEGVDNDNPVIFEIKNYTGSIIASRTFNGDDPPPTNNYAAIAGNIGAIIQGGKPLFLQVWLGLAVSFPEFLIIFYYEQNGSKSQDLAFIENLAVPE